MPDALILGWTSLAISLVALGIAISSHLGVRATAKRWTEESDRQTAAIDAFLTTPREPEPMPTVVRSPRPDRREASPLKGPTLIAVPNLSVAAPEATEMPADLARRFGAIWALADAGTSPESIARQTEQPVGQVELILGLRRTRSAEPRS